MSYLDDNFKRHAGFTGQSPQDAKDEVANMLRLVVGLRPSASVKTIAEALFYDIPYDSEFDANRLIKFYTLILRMTLASHRHDSERTIVRDDFVYQEVMQIICAVIEQLTEIQGHLQAQRIIYIKDDPVKEKADQEQSA